MRYEIKGTPFPVVICQLEDGEQQLADAQQQYEDGVQKLDDGRKSAMQQLHAAA